MQSGMRRMLINDQALTSLVALDIEMAGRLDDLATRVCLRAKRNPTPLSDMCSAARSLTDAHLRAYGLVHTLQPHPLLVRGSKEFQPTRTLSEAAVFERFFAAESLPCPLTVDALVELLGTLVSSLTEGRLRALRRSDVQLNGTQAKSLIVLPTICMARTALTDIARELSQTNDELPGVFVALLVFSRLLNAHPFADGNGRLSRVCFNLVMRKSYPEWPYLPLYELFYRSNGAFELSYREAEIFCNWLPLIDYFTGCLRFHGDQHDAPEPVGPALAASLTNRHRAINNNHI